MKAVVMTAVGDVEVLTYQEVDEPKQQSTSEVKIKLKAAGVNPIDTKLRAGGLFYENALPAILGCDGAGEIIEVGADVQHYQVGDRVNFCHGGLGKPQGNYAEFCWVDERWLSKIADNVSYVEAAAAPLVLITAWGALFERGGLQAGQTVLIQAGAGGVGHVAIQLAKLKGARVITTVSSPEKAAFVKGLGADEVIIYSQQEVIKSVMELTAGKGADLVFDTVGAEIFNQSIDAAAHYGTVVSLLAAETDNLGEARMKNLKIAFELMLMPMLRELDEARDQHINILNQCGQWMAEGKLSIHISKKLALSEAAIAHRLIEEGHTVGKIVLEI